MHWFKCISWTFFVKWTLEIYPGLQQKILSGLRRKSNPMTLMMSSLKATFPPTFCTGRRYYSQVWWRQFPYSDPNLNSPLRFAKPNFFRRNSNFLAISFILILKEWKQFWKDGLYFEHCIIALRVVARFAPLCDFTPFSCLHSVLPYYFIYKSSKQKTTYWW